MRVETDSHTVEGDSAAMSKTSLTISNQANIYLFSVNDRNTRKRCEICSELAIKTPEHTFSSVSIADFEQVNVYCCTINRAFFAVILTESISLMFKFPEAGLHRCFAGKFFWKFLGNSQEFENSKAVSGQPY